MFLTFHALREDRPGPTWQRSFDRAWPAYRRWFLSEGPLARPGYLSSRLALKRHMPELLPIYDELCELAGGGDLAARFLSMHRPPPYLAGCSQAVWTRGAPRLVRNYDYAPQLLEGVLLRSAWLRPVLAMSDCLWGALDGVNDAGLVASLAFGGRKVTGDGFGIPLLVRYLLETCDDVRAAVRALERLPSHMTYSVTLLDPTGDHATVHLAPDRPAEVDDRAVCTNHQRRVEWPDYVRTTASVERRDFLETALNDTTRFGAFVHAFLQPPLHATRYAKGFGTLYTAVYRPDARALTLHWPHHDPFETSLDAFRDDQTVVQLRPPQPPSLVE